MIGDTMETDILGGVQLGYKTVLVLSGGTQRESLKHYAYQPGLIVDSIAELHEMLSDSGWESLPNGAARKPTRVQPSINPAIRRPRQPAGVAD